MSHVADTLKCMNAARQMQEAIMLAMPAIKERQMYTALYAQAIPGNAVIQRMADVWLELTLNLEIALKASQPEPETVVHSTPEVIQ